MTFNEVLTVLGDSRLIGHRTWQACCPAHDDSSSSLMFGERNDGSVCFVCFGGCTAEEIERAVVMRMKEGAA